MLWVVDKSRRFRQGVGLRIPVGCGRILVEKRGEVAEKESRGMCERFEVPGSALRGPIAVEAYRDGSQRLTELVIINFDRNGNEGQGMRVLCRDNGDIVGGINLTEGVDILGHAEMRG